VDTSNLTNVRINDLIIDDISDANLNTKLEARAGTNITINSSGIISSSGSSGGTIYDDANRIDYEFLSEPIGETEGKINIAEPTSSPSVVITTIDQEYKYMSFPYSSGATNTPYTITFNEETECDILIVAGGGGGGTSYSSSSAAPAGGGGAGGLIFLENQTVSSGTYNILVGKGGDGDTHADTATPQRGKQGNNSSFSYHLTDAVGGGGGGSRSGNENGGDGGSGGGSGWGFSDGNSLGGSGVSGQGFAGGTSKPSGDIIPYASGGGGAGEIGHANNDSDNSVDGDGGIGKYMLGTFNFKEDFGLPVDNTLGEFFNGNVYFAGGGSCGTQGSNTSFGGKGGGANSSGDVNLLNGMSNTGGGGAGSRAASNGRTNGGNGGSGVVIIRYKYTKTGTIQNEVSGLLKYTKDNGWLIDTDISDTIISNTSLIAILQSQMIEVFAALTAKSINAVYEWATGNQDWKIVEADSNILMPQGNFQIRLRTINLFANNAVLPFFITVRDTTRSDGVVANTYTTYNSSDVILYQRQQNTAKQHDLRIRIDDNEGFTSPFFNVTISNLQWIIDNRS